MANELGGEHLGGRVRVRRLTPQAEPADEGVHTGPAGRLFQLYNRPDAPLANLTAWELGPGQHRGHHTHTEDTDCMFVVSGRVIVVVEDEATGERVRACVSAGETIEIDPGLYHVVWSPDGTSWVLELNIDPYPRGPAPKREGPPLEP